MGQRLFEIGEEWTYFYSPKYISSCLYSSILVDNAIKEGKLPLCAEWCWKIMIFGRPEEIHAATIKLLPTLEKNKIEAFKHDAFHQKDKAVLVIYAYEAGRDRTNSVLKQLFGRTFPYRRGCKEFEEYFGPWKQWEFLE